MDGFERRKERKKESIVNAALELFNAHGFKKVSINEIAKKAVVSPVSIYNHFGSKDALIKVVVKRLLDGIYEKRQAIFKADISFPEKMQQMLTAKTSAAYDFQGEHFQMDVYSDPELLDYIENVIMKKTNEQIAAFFAEGKRDGYINPEFSPTAISIYFEVFRQGWAGLKNLPKDPQELSVLIRELFNLCLYGFMGKPGKGPNFKVKGKE
ncbi:MAG: TetR/AcrR family transcriptional regulator [Chloroflexi bacterium]|jgi:TetR/AcrR family transcriptional regulator, cholesterol catabolism regulator|nr:TetR/AcrR family transcriptional regulator [Chloroflexota bacterium]MBT7080082.1 TetR/AcrR family transcriptional regulator [Chloroflexota bacterium]MBT7290472.1 TetR/AcrR family transcriptional regulator [Chloroflexota bacterium]